MTTTATQPTEHRRARLIELAMIVALSLSIIAGAWVLGSATAPDANDAAVARADAFEQAYEDARGKQFGPAYEAAWEPAFTTGAADGRREGAVAGAAAGRAATS